jgi:hypothetical protein
MAGTIPAGFSSVGPCVCIEVKPKAGTMPGAGSAVVADSIKLRLPRFTMHQLLKHLKVRPNAAVLGQLASVCFLGLHGGGCAWRAVGLHAWCCGPDCSSRLLRFTMRQLLQHVKVRCGSACRALLQSSWVVPVPVVQRVRLRLVCETM